MIGRRLAHYEILEKIGAGGMGQVYRARDTKLERDVAIKVLPEEMARDPERRMRFEREAKAVAALRHPHIVTIYSVEESDGVSFLTMELLRGRTLAESIPPGGFPLARFFELAIPIADAVGLAHSSGITHRDLKPGNVVLEHDRDVKVLDFGLAKMMSTGPAAETATVVAGSPVTGEGRVLGTAAYMAPEQAEGKPTDARSDVFSLGILFYEMITGERPFQGHNEISTLSSILRDTPPSVTDLKPAMPRHLGRIIRRCLEKDPERRYDAARALRNELESLQEELQSEGGTALQASSGTHAGIQRPAPPSSNPATGTPRSDSWPPSPSAPPIMPSGPSMADAARVSNPVASSPRRARPFSRRGWIVAASVAAVAGAIALGAFAYSRGSRASSESRRPPAVAATPATASIPSIVVFPFENLGPADDRYFAAGITDEITSRLGRVQGLAVMSRTTAVQYDRTGKTMPQIAADLGVEYVLDGTVRWERPGTAPSRVRVSPELIRAADDTQLWANSYDRSMDEIFKVQSDIATEVVDKLGLTLLGGEQDALLDAPTQNIDAYHAYLRGKELVERAGYAFEDWRVAIQMFERAVEYDPQFVEAYYQLSRTYSGMCHFEWDRSERTLVRAKAAADRTRQLAPDSVWSHLALGYYYYWGLKDYENAIHEFELADAKLPNNVDILGAMAYVDRRRGKFAEAEEILTRIQKMDPQNIEISYAVAETQTILGHYDEAAAMFESGIRFAPDVIVNYTGRALCALLEGDQDACRAVMETAPPATDPSWQVILWNVDSSMRRYDEALERAARLPDLRTAQFQMVCRPLCEALVLRAMAQPDRARASFEAARALIEAHLQSGAEDSNASSALALAEAGLGNEAAAVRAGKRALELFPANKDKWIRQHRLYDLVVVYTMLGNKEAAIDRLEELLSSPTDQLSIPLLRISPTFDPLRDDPRFQRLLQRTS